MSVQELIRSATNAGLRLSPTPDGGLNVKGPPNAIAVWTPVLKDNKQKILVALLPIISGLEMRMHAMFVRWKYNHYEATEFLGLARANPADWLVHVRNDEIFHAKLAAINSPLLPC